MKKLFSLLTAVLTLVFCVTTTVSAKDLRVAIDPTYKPFTYKTPDGKPTGFDVAIAEALCKQIQMKCVYVEQAWDGMIPGLVAKKYDAIISSMSITEERKKAVSFTGKYYNTASCVVVKKSLGLDSAKPKGFSGKNIGVLKGSTQEKYSLGELAKAGVNIVAYDAQDQVYLDIKSGRLDGTVADIIEVKAGFLDTPDGKDYACAGTSLAHFSQYFGVGAGIALRKQDTALLNQLNKAIGSIRASGEWAKIAEQFVPGVDLWGK